MSGKSLLRQKQHEEPPEKRGSFFTRLVTFPKRSNISNKGLKVNFLPTRDHEDEDVCSGVVDLFNEENHIGSDPENSKHLSRDKRSIDLEEQWQNVKSRKMSEVWKLPMLAAISIDLSDRYRKMKDEETRVSKIRKQAFQLVENDDLEGLLKLIADENTSVTDLEGEEKLSLESQSLIEPRRNMNLLHSALEENSQKISSYMIDNCSGEFLMKTYTNLEIQIPPSYKTCLHILAEQGHLELTELFLVKLRKQYPAVMPPFQALIQPILKDLPLDKVKKFVNEKVVTKAMSTKTRMNAAHLAAVNDHHKLLSLLAKHEVDLNAQDSSNETPLMWAVQKGNLDTFKELLRLGVDPNCINKFQCSALHLAVSNGQIETAEILIDNPATDLNLERIKNPRWVVEMVAKHNYVPLMKKLMEAKTRVRITQSNIIGALFIASKHGFEQIIEEILKENEKFINMVDDLGNTPVMVATENGNLAAVKMLIEMFSADLTLRNNFRETVYDLAMRQNSIDLLKYLMDQTKSDHMLNPVYLHSAAASGDIEKLDFILSAGPKLLESDTNDNTIFHTAAANNANEVLRYYLHKDDDLTDLQNMDGETPLHVSVRKGNLECVKTLLSMYARVDIGDKKNQNPLHVAVSSSSANEEIVSLLVARMKETYETLLNEQDCNGNTALHLAAFYRREELMEYLIDVDPEVENTDGETALHTAVRSGTTREVRTLLKLFYNSKKRNVDKKDEKGHTALFKSIEVGDHEKFELLLRYGADLTLKGSDGSTCMHQMIIYNRRDLFASDKFIAIYYTIVKGSVEWYCRKEALKYPMENTKEYFEYQMKAVRFLTSELYYDKCNALQFASKLGTGNLLKAMLQTRDVYKFTYDSKFTLPDVNDKCHMPAKYNRVLRNFLEDKSRASDLALYDVTHLIPMTESRHYEPLQLEVDLYVGSKLLQAKIRRTAKSCLEFIVNTNDENFINDTLDAEPFKFLVSKYWTLCRRGYEVLMWIHVVFMILFTYFSMPSSEFLSNRFNSLNNSSDPEDFKHKLNSVSLLGIFLIWPVFVMIYEIAMGVYYLSTFRRTGRLLKKGLFGSRKISDITSGLMRIPVGAMLFVFDNLSHISSISFCCSSVAWFVMAIYTDNPHAYLESLSIVLIFGWLHTINYVKGFKDWNYLASILKEILIKDITRFIYIYIFVLISFGYAIHALIQADYHLNPDSRHPSSTIYLTFYRMLSPGNILDVSEEKGYAESGGSVGILRAVCAAYSVLSTVVLMNMLIAMMNSTYSDIRNNKSTAWRIESLKIALWFEQKIPFLRRWNLLGFSAKLDYEQDRWYLSKVTEINLDEAYWENLRKESELSKEGNGDAESTKINRHEMERPFVSVMGDLSAQVESLKESLAAREDDNRLIKIVLNDLRTEIRRIHELSLETCTLSKLTRRLE